MSYMMPVFLVLMFGAFYFLLIRPQRKKQSEHQDFVGGLQEGDKVITIGGLYGQIDIVGDLDIVIQVEDGSRMKFLKSSIMAMQQLDEEVEVLQGPVD